jgi:8-oxo-dGTP diphosphatase
MCGNSKLEKGVVPMSTRMNSRYVVVPRTLCFVFSENDVLLIKRSPSRRLFPNKINGLGGHVEHDEDVYSSAAREIKEEAGIVVTDLWLAGVVNVDGALGQADPLAGGGYPGVMLFVFTAYASGRDVQGSADEGELLWVSVMDVAGLDWVDGDPGLLRRAIEAKLRGRPFFSYKGL